MNYFSQVKMMVWAIVVLVILNLGTLVALWMMNLRPGPPPMDRDHDFIESQLKLSPEQSRLFKIENDSHGTEFRKIMDSIDNIRKLLSDELFKSPLDTTTISQYIQQSGKLHELGEKMFFEHFIRLNAILTPEQKLKFRDFMKEMASVKGKNHGPDAPEPGNRGPKPPSMN